MLDVLKEIQSLFYLPNADNLYAFERTNELRYNKNIYEEKVYFMLENIQMLMSIILFMIKNWIFLTKKYKIKNNINEVIKKIILFLLF